MLNAFMASRESPVVLESVNSLPDAHALPPLKKRKTWHPPAKDLGASSIVIRVSHIHTQPRSSLSSETTIDNTPFHRPPRHHYPTTATSSTQSPSSPAPESRSPGSILHRLHYGPFHPVVCSWRTSLSSRMICANESSLLCLRCDLRLMVVYMLLRG